MSPPPPNRQIRPRRWVRRTLGLAAALGLTGLAMLYAFQTRLIFPGAATQGTPTVQVQVPPGAELVRLRTADGTAIVALFGPALTPGGQPDPEARHRPTLLYFYGNGYYLAAAAETDLGRLRRLGVNVLIPDYVGYGMSEGVPSESGSYATADASYAYLRSRPDVNQDALVVAGRSLGGAVAIDLAARRPAAGLIALCTFTSMAAMSARQFPLLPTSLLLRHKFDSLAKIGRVTCPILLGHGAADRFVPASMSSELAARASAPVTSFEVAGADHNDFYQVGAGQIDAEFRRFLAGLRPTP